MDGLISQEKLSDLIDKTRSLMEREIKTAHDAIPQVLNGAGLKGRTESEKRLRNAYLRRLKSAFKQNEAA